MAEALLTYDQHPPFAMVAVTTAEDRIELLGPDSVERVILETPPDVSAAVSAELDAASEEGAEPPSDDFFYLYELIGEMSDNADDDRSVASVLLGATPTEARRLGAFVAATAIEAGLTGIRVALNTTVKDIVDDRVAALRADQSGYEPADRDKVHQEAVEVSVDFEKHGKVVDAIIEELAAETAQKPVAEAARDARAFFDNVIIGDSDVLEQLEAPAHALYPPTPDELLAQGSELVTKIVEAVETPSGETEKSHLAQYRHGMRRAVAHVALTVAKTAGREQSSSAPA
jgi:hypothetical protein